MINIKKPYDNWQETTLRKGTKAPKICKDMFIADSGGSFTFCEVKNGQLTSEISLEKDEALNIISSKKLVTISSSTFSACKTYRTESSNTLIAELLGKVQIQTIKKLASTLHKK